MIFTYMFVIWAHRRQHDAQSSNRPTRLRDVARQHERVRRIGKCLNKKEETECRHREEQFALIRLIRLTGRRLRSIHLKFSLSCSSQYLTRNRCVCERAVLLHMTVWLSTLYYIKQFDCVFDDTFIAYIKWARTFALIIPIDALNHQHHYRFSFVNLVNIMLFLFLFFSRNSMWTLLTAHNSTNEMCRNNQSMCSRQQSLLRIYQCSLYRRFVL